MTKRIKPKPTARASPQDFASRVYAIVRQCPRGKAVSYGAVAAMLGKPRAARAVGRALNLLDDDTDVPWWRVINSTGAVSIRGAGPGAALQRKLLQREGVRFRRDRLDWDRYGWIGVDSTDERMNG